MAQKDNVGSQNITSPTLPLKIVRKIFLRDLFTPTISEPEFMVFTLEPTNTGTLTK